jgi:FtsH-binding integral membrane protein
MSLAGHRSGNEPASLMLVVYSFLLGSLAYPVVYIFCASNALAQAGKHGKAALWFAASPLGYLLLLVGLMVLWSGIERVRTTS